MKILVSICLSVLVCTVLLSYLPVHGEEEIYENTVRLHVIAASDSEEDQALKLHVRDRVLDFVSQKLENVEDHATACALLDGMKDELAKCAEAALSEAGDEREVSVEFGREKYPVRYYEGFTLPAGNYNSLRVVLGEGAGKNWWCILFPSVCISDAVKAKEDYVAAGFTPEQYKLIENGSGKKYKVRFKILEVLSDVIGFKY